MNIYVDEYRKKRLSAEDAVASISNGNTIIHGATIAEPPALLKAIADRLRAGDLKEIEIYSFNPQKHASDTYLKSDIQDAVIAKSWFLSPATRKLASTGLVQFIPSYLHQVPKFIREYMDVDVCVTTVSPMDNAGFFQFWNSK